MEKKHRSHDDVEANNQALQASEQEKPVKEDQISAPSTVIPETSPVKPPSQGEAERKPSNSGQESSGTLSGNDKHSFSGEDDESATTEDDDQEPNSVSSKQVSVTTQSARSGVVPSKPSSKSVKFICGVCNKEFGTKGSLKTHNRVHTGEKPFVCPVPGCGRSFSQHPNCVRHVKLLHADYDPKKSLPGRKSHSDAKRAKLDRDASNEAQSAAQVRQDGMVDLHGNGMMHQMAPSLAYGYSSSPYVPGAGPAYSLLPGHVFASQSFPGMYPSAMMQSPMIAPGKPNPRFSGNFPTAPPRLPVEQSSGLNFSPVIQHQHHSMMMPPPSHPMLDAAQYSVPPYMTQLSGQLNMMQGLPMQSDQLLFQQQHPMLPGMQNDLGPTLAPDKTWTKPH